VDTSTEVTLAPDDVQPEMATLAPSASSKTADEYGQMVEYLRTNGICSSGQRKVTILFASPISQLEDRRSLVDTTVNVCKGWYLYSACGP
jgi:hypothetical protein